MPRGLPKSVKSNLPLHKGEDFTGKIIGGWTVLGFHSYTKTKNSNVYRWLCQCSCGITRPVTTSSLLYGRSERCLACANDKGSGEANPNWKGYGEVPGTVLQKIRMSILKRDAKRNLAIDVDCEYLDSLWKAQQHRCCYSGRLLSMGRDASVDRIDSAVGYIKGNVQWVHVDVNRAKWELTEEDFLQLCLDVAHNTSPAGGDR